MNLLWRCSCQFPDGLSGSATQKGQLAAGVSAPCGNQIRAALHSATQVNH